MKSIIKMRLMQQTTDDTDSAFFLSTLSIAVCLFSFGRQRLNDPRNIHCLLLIQSLWLYDEGFFRSMPEFSPEAYRKSGHAVLLQPGQNISNARRLEIIKSLS